jgi:L-histidine Nalpha-methyltransferase
VVELVLDRSEAFLRDVIDGLSASRKFVPSRYFYDRRGSELFEEITRLPEYYPTRTEMALLEAHSRDVATYVGKGRSVIEFGSGSSTKTPIFLAATEAAAYVPIDISADFLEASSARFAEDHPGLRVVPVAGDFSRRIDLPDVPGPLIGFFPGSTIGNFHPVAAVDLLRSFRETLGDDAWLVIGLDTRKNQRLLEAAYDDSDGVTAAFNLNILHRINRELGGNIPVELFEHRAVWHDGKGRIEMHLVALQFLAFEVAGTTFEMSEGETIHTENSYKYVNAEAAMMARTSGWEPMAKWTDKDGLFSLHVWRAASAEGEP